jgi:hypothetical protein
LIINKFEEDKCSDIDALDLVFNNIISKFQIYLPYISLALLYKGVPFLIATKPVIPNSFLALATAPNHDTPLLDDFFLEDLFIDFLEDLFIDFLLPVFLRDFFDKDLGFLTRTENL